MLRVIRVKDFEHDAIQTQNIEYFHIVAKTTEQICCLFSDVVCNVDEPDQRSVSSVLGLE